MPAVLKRQVTKLTCLANQPRSQFSEEQVGELIRAAVARGQNLVSHAVVFCSPKVALGECFQRHALKDRTHCSLGLLFAAGER